MEIHIRIRTILKLKKIIGKGAVEFSVKEGTTLEEALDKMIATFGKELESSLFSSEDRSLLQHIRLIVNGRDIAFLNGLQTVLKEGDEILILPPVSGG